MAISADEFKKGMRRLGGAVTIVAAEADGVRAGLTATAVTSLSAEPPRLLACVNRGGGTFDTISRGRNLSVNVLSVLHQPLAIRFAGLDGCAETERFTVGEWETSQTGAPYLLDALVSFQCSVETILDAGSHGIVIGNIEAVELTESLRSEPLFYMDGAWASLQPVSETQ